MSLTAFIIAAVALVTFMGISFLFGAFLLEVTELLTRLVKAHEKLANMPPTFDLSAYQVARDDFYRRYHKDSRGN